MTKFNGKTWVITAAAAIIIVSSSVMTFALGNSVPQNTSIQAAPYTVSQKENTPNQLSTAAEYTVVDASGGTSLNKELVFTKLKIQGMTQEQMEAKYNEFVANMTPSEKDISAEQAAAYAADILHKAYGIDFKGYTAEASFSRNDLPNSGSWTVIFRAPQAKSYLASVDSINGIMQNASTYDLSYEAVLSKNIEDPAWIDEAKADVLKVMPKDVTITGSSVVLANPAGGVIVVCELSNGAACAVRLEGDNMAAVAYIYFPDGYDGSLDYHPVTEDSVG